MRGIRFLLVAVVLAGLTAAAGCGGTRDRGRNQDLDRPKASERSGTTGK